MYKGSLGDWGKMGLRFGDRTQFHILLWIAFKEPMTQSHQPLQWLFIRCKGTTNKWNIQMIMIISICANKQWWFFFGMISSSLKLRHKCDGFSIESDRIKEAETSGRCWECFRTEPTNDSSLTSGWNLIANSIEGLVAWCLAPGIMLVKKSNISKTA